MIRFTVNGRKQAYRGQPFKRLIDVLREDLRLTGTKEGCGEGECGACTVLVDGQPMTSCIIPICQMEGRKIETVESLGTAQRLAPLQRSFVKYSGAQCGFCTPGILMTASASRARKPADIRRALAGHLCRCTGYQPIVAAVAAAKKSRRPKP